MNRKLLPPGAELDRLISPNELEAVLGVSKTQLRHFVKTGVVPPPVKLSERKMGWWKSQVDRYRDTGSWEA